MRVRVEIEETQNYRLSAESSIFLNCMGIILDCGSEWLGLEYAGFATLVEQKELFRYSSELKKPAKAPNVDRTGLALY